MISTHILDTQVGRPATNVQVILSKIEGDSWKELQKSSTNGDGRISFDCKNEQGKYKLDFNLSEYFHTQNNDFFFTEAPLIFQIKDTARKYHVPILLSSFGYTTYRGS